MPEHVLAYLRNIYPASLFTGFGIFTGVPTLFILLVLIFVFLYGISVGKTRALLSLLAIYTAFVLITLFPYEKRLLTASPGALQAPITHSVLFLVFYVLAFFALNHSSLRHRLSMGEISFWRVLVISVVQVGFLSAILISFFPQETTAQLLGRVSYFFGSTTALFYWSIGSLAILPFMRSRRSD